MNGNGRCIEAAGARRLSRGAQSLGLAALLCVSFAQNLPAQGIRRADAGDLERRNRMMQEIQKDMREFGKDDFDDTMNQVRSRTITLPSSVDTREALDSARRVLDSLAQEADRLQQALRDNVDYVYGLKSIWQDVIPLNASIQVLADRARRESRLSPLAPELESLDLQWQQVSYKLKQMPQLDAALKQRVDRIDGLRTQLSQIFKIKSQYDNRELASQTASLDRDMHNLEDDIRYELTDLNIRRQLEADVRRAQSIVHTMSDAIDANYEGNAVVTEFNRFREVFQNIVKTIRPLNSRYLERTVRRSELTVRNISELLRIPNQNNSGDLAYQMEALKRDVDEYFTRAPLKLLMELPDSKTALVTAGEFYGVCENFLDNARNNASQAELAQSFVYVEDSWNLFDRTFRPLNSSSAQLVLNRIAEGLYALRDSLQVYDRFDRRKAAEFAYDLQNAAEIIDRETRSWLSRERPPFREQALRETQGFLSRCRAFSEQVSKPNVPVSQLRPQLIECYEQYRTVYSYISQCRSSERQRLGQAAARTKNALVELRTLLEI